MGVKSNFVLFIVGLLIFVLGLALIIYGAVDYESEKEKSVEIDRVGVVIDAGGSGTRIIIYSYVNETFQQVMYEKCERTGMAKYPENELSDLKDKLDACFKKGAAKVPKGKKVPIYFLATAGMRILKLRNPAYYDKVWAAIRERIEASEFKLAKANTISGFEEAKWAWVAANYLKKTIDSKSTVGIIEFGSSSVQLAFEQKNITGVTSESIKSVGIDGNDKMIYGHSYLCYGASEVERRMVAKVVKDSNYSATVSSPCFFSGFEKEFKSEYLWAAPCSSGDYAKTLFGEELTGPMGRNFTIKGSGNFEKCSKIFTDMITYKCSNSSTCGINKEFQPQVKGKFLALGAFNNAARTLSISVGSTNEGFLNKSKTLCGQPWSNRATFEAGEVSKYTYQRCLQSVFSYFLLNNGFKFNQNDWQVSFVDKISNTGVAWSLGMVYTKKDELFSRTRVVIEIIVKQGLIAAIIIGIICFLGGLAIAYKCSRRSKDAGSGANVSV